MIITVFTINNCSGSNSGKVINSADALKEYLDSQPANSPDKPINVIMNVNNLMISDITKVINSAGKYVNLDLSRSNGLTEILHEFKYSKSLTGIIIPDSVKYVSYGAFSDCNNLTNINVIGFDNSLNGTWDSSDHWLKLSNGFFEWGFYEGRLAGIIYSGVCLTKDGIFIADLFFNGSYSLSDNTLTLGDEKYTRR